MLKIIKAIKQSDIDACRKLMAFDFYEQYKLTLQDNKVDLVNRIEPFPDEYIACYYNDKLVGCQGYYIQSSFICRYGLTTREIEKKLSELNATKKYAASRVKN